jgi:hypothetical protein
MNSRLKVIYIAGWGRSGSTILQNLLGEIDGFQPLGELYSIGRRYLEKHRCGCGEPLDACGQWKAILDHAFGSFDPAAAGRLHRSLHSVRTRHLPLLLTSPGRQRVLEQSAEARSDIAKLYAAAQQHTGCEVLIDSSKNPLFGFLLTAVESIDVSFVHLVRDPRGVAFSGQRSRLLHGRRDRVRQSRSHPAKTSIMWNFWNLAARRLLGKDSTRYMCLRYEDFVECPRETLQLILSLVGEPRDSLPFVSAREVRLGPSHTVGGNPARYRTGMVQLRPDDEWQGAMTLSDKSLVRALTWPLLGRYGY